MKNEKFSETAVKGVVLGRNILSVLKLKESREGMKGLTLRTRKVIESIEEPCCAVDLLEQADGRGRCLFHGRGVYTEELYVPLRFLVPCKSIIPTPQKKKSEFSHLMAIAV